MLDIYYSRVVEQSMNNLSYSVQIWMLEVVEQMLEVDVGSY